MSRAPALIASAALHGGLLAAFMAWPKAAEPPKPAPVPVRLIPPPPDGPAEVSTAPEPEVGESQPSPEPPAPEPAPEPTPQPPATEPSPAPARPTLPTPTPPRPTPPVSRPTPRQPTPAPTPRPAPPRPSPPQPAPAKPAPRPAEQPLDLSALGDRLARNTPRRAPASPARPAGASPGELASARAELGQRLQRLWRPNCGPDDSLAVNVRVRFRLNGGRIQGSPELVGGRSDDPVVRAAQERALAAVRAAAPYDWLPEEMRDGDYQPSFNAEQACG